eukprot:scaffold3871_cov97-Isochrysis_galbana.AAC.13
MPCLRAPSSGASRAVSPWGPQRYLARGCASGAAPAVHRLRQRAGRPASPEEPRGHGGAAPLWSKLGPGGGGDGSQIPVVIPVGKEGGARLHPYPGLPDNVVAPLGGWDHKVRRRAAARGFACGRCRRGGAGGRAGVWRLERQEAVALPAGDVSVRGARGWVRGPRGRGVKRGAWGGEVAGWVNGGRGGAERWSAPPPPPPHLVF